MIAAVDGARIVKESYERQFIAGRKSWLDVLNAVREQEQFAAELVQARVDFIAAYYRLKLGVGLLPWQQKPMISQRSQLPKNTPNGQYQQQPNLPQYTPQFGRRNTH